MMLGVYLCMVNCLPEMSENRERRVVVGHAGVVIIHDVVLALGSLAEPMIPMQRGNSQ